jgi:transcriptional regulator with XRE-family HTH domain
MTLHEKIKLVRKASGFSKDSLAERSGISIKTLSEWESGAVVPEGANMSKLAKALGVTVKYLLDGNVADIPKPKKNRFATRVFVARVAMGIGTAGIIAAFIAASALPAQKALPILNDIIVQDGVISQSTVTTSEAPLIETRGDVGAFLDTYNLWLPFIICCVALAMGATFSVATPVKDKSL